MKRRHGDDPALTAVVAVARRLAALEERVGELAASLGTAWPMIERAARGPVLPSATPLEAPRSLAPRVGAGEAAKLMGCDVSTVRRHVRAGRLTGAVYQIPGTLRRRWTVETSEIERLVGSALLPAAARSKVDSPGAPRARKGR